MSYMGHTEKINEHNYQCPPGLREVREMGRLLDDNDTVLLVSNLL